jgi:hypothetical protein
MNVGFSRWLAIAFGVLIPSLGIVKNWTDAKQDAFGFFADIALGSFLLVGAWKVGQNEHSGKRFLSAAWGLACGLLYASLVRQIDILNSSVQIETDVGSEWSATAAILGLLVSIVGLISSLKSMRTH